MLKFFCAGCAGLSTAVSAQLTFKMCVAAQNCETFIKTFYFGSSRSFKFIDADSPKILVTSACYDKQHVCAYLQLFLRYMWTNQ